MKSIWLKSLSGEMIPLSYEGDVYTAILDAVDTPPFHIVKLFSDEGLLDREPVEEEVPSFLICEADFQVDFYNCGEVVVEEENNSLEQFVIKVFTESEEDRVGVFYYDDRKNSLYSCRSIVPTEDFQVKVTGQPVELEELVLEFPIPTDEEDVIITDSISKVYFRKLFLDKWKSGLRKWKYGQYVKEL
jgi:hypothetical protein